MTEDMKDTIKQNAEGPKQASVDGVSTQQHSMSDQIEADKYLAAKKAARAKGLGIKLAKISPGGTV